MYYLCCGIVIQLHAVHHKCIKWSDFIRFPFSIYYYCRVLLLFLLLVFHGFSFRLLLFAFGSLLKFYRTICTPARTQFGEMPNIANRIWMLLAMCNYAKNFVHAHLVIRGNESVWSNRKHLAWHALDEMPKMARKQENEEKSMYSIYCSNLCIGTQMMPMYRMKYDCVFTIRHVVSDRNHFMNSCVCVCAFV